MAEFRMPSLGADMEAGTLVEWLVKPGDRVRRGDIVAVVETDKGAIEIEIFEAGTIERLLVEVGTEVPVGMPLALVVSASEAAAVRLPQAQAPVTAPPVAPPPAAPRPEPPKPAVQPAEPRPVERQPPAPPSRPAAPTSARARVSPAARRLAAARGVDLTAISGSGPEGAIVVKDLEQHPAAAPAASRREPPRAAGLDLDAMRSAIAAAMARSKREIPHYYLAHDVDLTRCMQWLADENARRAPENRLLPGVVTIKAVALAARQFPAFNGFHRNGRFEPSEPIHTGIAIAIRGGGLAAPAIHDTPSLTLDDLMARLRDLVQRTRAGRMRSSEIGDPTITISSLGDRGVEVLYGVIYPPQVAIVGIGKPVLRPWVIDGAIGPRSVATITLAADHRVSDGHAGALFLAEIGRLLQAPETL